MRDTPIGNLMRAVKTIGPEDAIGKAAELLRVSGLPELPVLNAGRIAGKVTEGSLLKALNAGDPKTVSAELVTGIVSQNVVCVSPHASIGQVAQVMTEQNLAVIPVADEYGTYFGLAVRSDITTALSLTIRPPVVAGMATPLGVYLTTGNIRAGAGDFALMLSGVSLMLLQFVALGIVYGISRGIDYIHLFGRLKLHTMLSLPPGVLPVWMDVLRLVVFGASIPIFLILLRLLPLSGYHAAEHQVVHAIENGEPLEANRVREMPRVHPRCGTNIIAGVALFFLLRQLVSDDVAIMLFVFMLVFAWRVIGSYFQYYVTTKPPTIKQVESGIHAAESLLQQYRKNPGQRVTGWRRIWYTGMPQVMIGAAVTMGAQEWIGRAVAKFF